MNYSSENTLLYVENLSVAYGDKTIIKDINLVEKDVIRTGEVTGQVIAVVGRSGTGKSTFFKALTGLVKPTSGKVLIADTTTENAQNDAKEVHEGDIGFVDQKYTLFRNKTVYEALLFALRNKEMPKEAKHEQIVTYLKDWGLEKAKDQYPCELSGGQRQRTAIIEQIFSSGHYMVLDEPFSGLDVGNIEDVKNAFKLITKSHEYNTIIYSTHDIELAVELADSIYVIGYPEVEGKKMTYGSIVKHFDMKEIGLAWKEFGLGHLDIVKQIKTIMLQS
ncbi:ABC transporter ATP-binding protein [Cellulophaga sp. HaHa_2_95]|uniref:energy-coupling factor ABC transporter ATP-binding protein n=1 Tax=unclassified Cellulophaga TaxID=2634405 RepID=UPI001C50048D|nr:MULTISPECIES: ATP-binding cassette domain-containing protein [unclassified Cellulophaga]QXP51239.1 ABC transporter ATP-binding protein [Cellulophaga sp. HaHa_2_1]QXP56430.1 ABC transporter ATP-binding protein [Cellulophaga sp. HaHa_2_95]